MPASLHKPNQPAKLSSSPAEPAGSATLSSLTFPGPAGRLEALLNESAGERSETGAYCALICHPHPLGGGSMHNKVVYHAAKVLSARGWPVLRFNFRGVGLSEGVHHGSEEAGDVLAALDWLAARYSRPIVAAGFSFGAAMGLEAASERLAGIAGFAALGAPTHAEGRDYDYSCLAKCTFPKLFLSGGDDQYAPAEQLRRVSALAPAPSELVLIPGADHFFLGQLPAMQAALGGWLDRTFFSGSDPASTISPGLDTPAPIRAQTP